MVKNKAIIKDALRELKITWKTFLSILLIILLGSGFFVGLKSTSYDMKNTAKKYYKDTNLMDIKINTNIDINEEELIQISKINNINGIMPVKTVDAITSINSKKHVVKLLSLPNISNKNDKNYINKLILTDGRYPSTINEGVVEEAFLKENNLVIGSLVTLEPENKNDLRAKKIKIVGTVKNSYFSSKDRGTSNLLGGKVNYFMYLPSNDFTNKTYKEVYLTINGANKYDTYSKDYDKYVSGFKEELTNVLLANTKQKYENMVNNLTDEINTLTVDVNSLINSDAPEETINEDISKLNKQIEEKNQELNSLNTPVISVVTRNQTPSFYEYKLETERIKNISSIFPLIFFLVAALVSLTSMTRIVEEERNQIGTLRALGYSKLKIFFKYLLYSLASSLIGSILGVLIFYKSIPLLVAFCYNSLYEMPTLITTMQIKYALIATLTSVLVTTGTAALVFFFEVKNQPAILMKPVAPKEGRKIFLENISIIWKKLNFYKKITCRNIFRYKKRLFMTLIGICGCTALLLTAFGIKDSVTGIIKKQYKEINNYDLAVNMPTNSNNDLILENEIKITDNKNVTKTIKAFQSMITIEGKTSEVSYLIVPENSKKYKDFVNLKSSNGKEKFSINDEGIIISEKLSTLINVKKNDKVTLTTTSGKKIKVKVSGIAENYINHYVYMSKNLYESLTKDKVINNTIFIKVKKLNDNTKSNITNSILSLRKIQSVNFLSDEQNDAIKSMQGLNYVIIILTIGAAALAFTVLFTLSSINLQERKKELATIKVLGFYDKEVTKYIHDETVILTIMGSLLGLLAGSFLTYYVVKACETSLFMFDFNIKFISYIGAFILTLLFLFIVNTFMYFEIKKINMAEALKSIE